LIANVEYLYSAAPEGDGQVVSYPQGDTPACGGDAFRVRTYRHPVGTGALAGASLTSVPSDTVAFVFAIL
jgi:hypothetical protein